jgi:hypothetical protein
MHARMDCDGEFQGVIGLNQEHTCRFQFVIEERGGGPSAGYISRQVSFNQQFRLVLIPLPTLVVSSAVGHSLHPLVFI